MNKQELKQATKKLLSSPLMIAVAVLMILSIVADAVIMIIRHEFGILSLALNNVFTIFFIVFIFMMIFKKEGDQQAAPLEGIRKVIKVKLVLTIIGLAAAIVGFLILFIAFSIITKDMINQMDIEQKYRDALEAFLAAKKVFILSALFFAVQLATAIGFHSGLSKTIKNAKYATFEDEHYHKGSALSAAVWGFLFFAVTIASIWLEIWMVKGLAEPFATLEGVVEGFKAPTMAVSVVSHLRDFIYAAAVLVVIIMLVMHYSNVDKLKEAHVEEPAEEAKEEPAEEAKEESAEEAKEEPAEEVKEESAEEEKPEE